MGLLICQKIIQSCGGKISFFSEGDNKGSTFIFSIKMSQARSSMENLSINNIEEEFKSENLAVENIQNF